MTLIAALGRRHQAVGKTRIVLEMIALGMKGAALAALGEIAAGFFPTAPAAFTVAPFGERKEGVKLGESTFSDFLTCALLSHQHDVSTTMDVSDLSPDTGATPFAIGDLKSATLWL